MTFRQLLLSWLFVVASCVLRAGEGMWIPLLLGTLNEAEMQSMGMRITAEDIYSVNQGSLKDAIVNFAGCTGSIISHEGLVLTNHHCGYGIIQDHSTIENNLLRNGFWAMSRDEELPNEELFVTFIVRIEDVTASALEGVDPSLAHADRQSAIDRNLNAVRAATTKEPYQDVVVRAFFEGNQYFLFVTETYRDVRLVGAPPEAIGKFGADTDNWEWPRHTGDFALFRVYAAPDNTPAAYAVENVPLKPRHALPVSLKGVSEGDFTLVFGFPGRTEQYLPSYAIEQLIEVTNPARISIRDLSLGIMDRAMRRDEETRLRFASRFAGLANSWKRWIGERQGLMRTGAVEKKRMGEEEFSRRLHSRSDWKEKYTDILPQFALYYDSIRVLERQRIFYNETFGINVHLFRLISRLAQINTAYYNGGDAGFTASAGRLLDWLEDFYGSFDPALDREICVALLEHMVQSLEADEMPPFLQDFAAMDDRNKLDFFDGLYSGFAVSWPVLSELIASGGGAFAQAFEGHPAVHLLRDVQEKSDADIAPDFNRLSSALQTLQRRYMTALMVVFPERRFWPDANGTLRVSYGLVEGYTPRDAVRYEPVTYLDGVIEKYVPGDYEFDLPDRLLELHANGDYGPYADATGKLPVCFLGSNHTTGGNSGSPAIDAHGNLIGVNFDRVWEGTMSDYNYDLSICRNIMVDARYILFITDVFAGAGYLLDEMEIVGSVR